MPEAPHLGAHGAMVVVMGPDMVPGIGTRIGRQLP